MAELLRTERIRVRDWAADDAEAALAIYGQPEVAHWLTPAMQRVEDTAEMVAVLQAWIEAQSELTPPLGRWAIERQVDGTVIGGLAIQWLPPGDEDLELSWQLRPDSWGHGYATEAGRAVIRWAFTEDVNELFAIARPNNRRAIATAERLGMSWVGETTKYYDLRLQVYRVRPSDLD